MSLKKKLTIIGISILAVFILGVGSFAIYEHFQFRCVFLSSSLINYRKNNYTASKKVDIDKEWKVNFNKDVAAGSFENISAVDSSGKTVKLDVKVDDNKKFIVMKPKGEGYDYGKNYTIKIDNVKSTSGKQQQFPFFINFKTTAVPNFVKPISGIAISKKVSSLSNGLDIRANSKSVFSVVDGVIDDVTPSGKYYNISINSGNGIKAFYYNVKKANNITKGFKVSSCDKIAELGDDSSLLKFNMMKNNTYINPLEYIKYGDLNSKESYVTVSSEVELLDKVGGSKNDRHAVTGKVYKVLGEESGYYKIAIGRTSGFIPQSSAVKLGYAPKEKTSMAWTMISNKNANKAFLNSSNCIINNKSNATGLDVISPTWLYCSGSINNASDITVKERADSDVVKTAHNNGYEVWAMFSNGNGENGEKIKDSAKRLLTMLGSDSAEDRVIKNVYDYAEKYDLDGINVDFEGFGADGKSGFVKFVQKLSSKLHSIGVKVSVDITRPGDDSSMYSGSYDRGNLAKASDYIVLMAYDEHYSGGSEAGSVASYNWVKEGISATIDEGVNKDKLILGVPFYIRDFIFHGDKIIKSYSYDDLGVFQRLYDKHKSESTTKYYYDKKSKQNVLQFNALDDDENDLKHMIWAEDGNSAKWRMKLINDYDLKGVSAWQISQKNSSFWSEVSDYFHVEN